MKKTITILVILAVIGAALFWFFRKDDAVPITWRTAKVEQGDINTTVTATGTLNALTTVQVGTQVSGTIARLYADYNSVVKKGQVIAVLDTTYLGAAVEDAVASENRAQIQVDQMKREYDRQKKLFDQKVIAQVDYDKALADYETAKSNLVSSKAQLNRARINLKYATITAPISGVVVSRNVDLGQTVAASFNTPTLFTIANDLTKMQVEASVDEADIGQVKVGQSVDFTVDAYPDLTFNGQVTQIRLQPNVVQDVVNYTVIIDVPNPDKKLMPGMTANITINVESHKDVLKVPAAALMFRPPPAYFQERMENMPDSVKRKWHHRRGRDSGKMGNGRPHTWNSDGAMHSEQKGMGHIWVKNGDRIHPVRVKTGLSDGTYTEVSGNLKPGEEVITGATVPEGSSSRSNNPFSPMGHFHHRH